MIDILFGVCVGLIVGWNLLPQPAWVRNLYTQAVEWVRSRRA